MTFPPILSPSKAKVLQCVLSNGKSDQKTMSNSSRCCYMEHEIETITVCSDTILPHHFCFGCAEQYTKAEMGNMRLTLVPPAIDLKGTLEVYGRIGLWSTLFRVWDSSVFRRKDIFESRETPYWNWTSWRIRVIMRELIVGWSGGDSLLSLLWFCRYHGRPYR
jgi:hypothetical protein